MKKALTLILTISGYLSYSQIVGPVIEGTYLPVRGTAVVEIWDMNSTITVPAPGVDHYWDYSTEFTSPTSPYRIETFVPDTTPYFSNFQSSTHGSYLTAPLSQIDSLYSYYVVDTGGLYMVGGRSTKAVPSSGDYIMNDTTAIYTKRELYVPANVYYQREILDTSKVITYGRISGFNVMIRSTKYKGMTAVGYGSITMPDGKFYDDVLLTKITVKRVDSAFSLGGTFLGVPGNPLIENYIEYSFLRNNTFGASALMYLNVNQANTSVNYGWYTLPVDFGYISGTVYDSLNELNVVKYGEAYLYREHSNFSKDDILAKVPLDTLGRFKFDSIPYGQYRVAIRPDLDTFPNALTTYYGDTTDWLGAPTISTYNDSTSDGHKIHLQYHPEPAGQGQLSGFLNLNWGIRVNNPIPGIDIIVRKEPGGSAFRQDKTGLDGQFEINNLDDGEYKMFVDMPGLYMDSTYHFTINGATVHNCLDFMAGQDSIHPTCMMTSVKQFENRIAHLMEVYPNPHTSSATVKVVLTEKSDVQIEMYNLLGEKVTMIEKGQKQPGAYTYNVNTDGLPSGIYLLKLKANQKLDILKMIKQ